MHPIKAFFKRKFGEPDVYARIAELLQTNHMVKVRYRNRTMIRYYTGSGNVCCSKLGLRRRWNVHVERYNRDEPNREYHILPAQYVWNDPDELKLVQAYGWDNVIEMTAIPYHEHSADDIVKFLHSTAGKLKPGQGYKFGNYYITKDLYGDDGYKFMNNDLTWHVPTHMVGNYDYLQGHALNVFDNERVFVANDNLIKRQHRKHTDIKRWYECKQVPSSQDKHVLTFTPRTTGQTPVFYYNLTLTIDDKTKAGHPFYVTAILHDAISTLKAKHSCHQLVIDQSAIQIEWDRETYNLVPYVLDMERFPTRVDTHPIVIHDDDLVTEYCLNDSCYFKLVTEEKA